MKVFRIFAPVLILISFLSCKKDPDPVVKEEATSEIKFRFKPVAKDKAIADDTTYYANSTGDMFTVTKFNYYISNVKLHRDDGFVFAEPESYHLIRHVEGDESFTVSKVPAGSYNAVTFLIGVDSLRNVSGAQSGALDPALNMFWDWNTGYIFYKLEGHYIALSSDQNDFAFHIGGFAGEHSCLQTAHLALEDAAVLSGTAYAEIEINADAAGIFVNPHQISFDDYFLDPPTPLVFQKQSENYSNMFSVVSTKHINR